MLIRLRDLLRNELPDLLDDPSRWDSLIINRRKPETYRIFTYLPDGMRVALHRFTPCTDHEAFTHPHPWAAAFAILSGAYKMTVGYSVDLKQAAMNDSAITLILREGARYEILDPRTWHSVIPIEATYTVMINDKPWEPGVAHAQVRTTKGKDLEKMTPDELANHLAKFKDLLERFT